MFVHYRTRGIILKKEDRGEADQLFTVYTKNFGKLEILGRAIRKISSKLRSAVEIFYLSEIEFIQGKTQKTLTDAILIDKFGNLRRDLKKLTIAYKISEVLDNLVKGQESDEKIWQLLNEIFDKLNSYKLRVESYKLIYYYFLWNLFAILGYQPELYFCLSCQKKLIPQNLYFFVKEGGLFCSNCQRDLKEDLLLKIRPETVKILRIVLEKDLISLFSLKIEREFLEELKLISKNYFDFLSNQTLK